MSTKGETPQPSVVGEGGVSEDPSVLAESATSAHTEVVSGKPKGLGECGAKPKIAVDPDVHDFGRLRQLDADRKTLTITITNPGDAVLHFREAAGPSGHVEDFTVSGAPRAGDTLAPQSTLPTAKVEITVTCRLKGAGSRNLSLRIASDASNVDAPVPVTLTAEGIPLVPMIEVDPPTLDFKNFRVGDRPVSREVKIRNTGDAPLTLNSVAVADDAASCYEFDKEKPWRTPVPAGESTSVWVNIDPKQAGKLEAKLKITSNAGNKESVTAPLQAAAFSIENLRVPGYVASGEDEVDVLYKVNDPAAIMNELKLEIVSKDGGENVIHTKVLDPKYYQDGERTFEKWKGEVTTATEYPDGFATIVHSPYLFRLTASAPDLVSTPKGESTAVAAKEFKVEAEKLEIEAGPRTLLKNAKYRDVYDGSLPGKADVDPKKLYLKSDIYYQAYREDHANNATDLNEYNTMWSDGPLIPVYARVSIKSASGAAKPAPLAWGTAQVFWDCEDVATGTAGLSAKQAAFVGTAQDRWKANAKPAGDNCPGDLGGKRTLAGNDRRVLPESSAYPGSELNPFPFTCTAAADPRPWGVYSATSKADGETKGRTGIVFRPSRMAGDRYRIKAYLDIRKQHYQAKDITEPISDSTGVFEVWRRLHVQKVYSKDSGNITSFVHSEVAGLYGKAFIDLVYSAGGPEAMPASYNTAFRDAIAARSETLMKEHAVQDRDNQLTAAGKAAVAIRSYTDFKNSYVRAARSTGVASDDLAEDALRIALSAASVAEMEKKYHEEAYKFAGRVTEKACDTLLGTAAGDGVVVFLFENITTQEKLYQSTNGQAIGPGTPGQLPNSEARRSRTGYMQFKPAAAYEAPQSITQTVAHEIGHQVFLPHTIMETNAADPAAHDAGHFGCLMSYSFDVTREFCGYCLLRLRGWDHTKLTNRISQNQLQPAIQVTAGGAFAGSGTERTFTITSTGNAPLVVSEIKLASGDTADFRIEGAPGLPRELATTATTTFRLVFDPKSAGEKTVQVSIASNAPDSPKVFPLSATGKDPVLTVAVDAGGLAPTDFGRAAADSDVTRTYTITNTGDGSLQIGQIRLAGDQASEFALNADAASNQALARTQSQTVQVVFHSRLQGGEAEKRKKIEGARSAQLMIPSNALDAPRTVDLKAENFLPAILSVTPASVPFDATEVTKSSSSQTITIKNTGGLPLTVTRIERTGGDAALFTCDKFSGGDVWTGSEVLDPGKYIFLFVTFSPVDPPGAKNCTITVTSNAPVATASATLQGTATPGIPRLSVTPSVNYPDTEVGLRSGLQSFTIANEGGAPMTITRVERTGDHRAMFTCDRFSGGDVWQGNETVAPGNRVNIFVTFAPADPPEAKTCTLTVTTNAQNPTASVTLQGTATPGIPRLSVTPPTVNYPDTEATVRSGSQTITIKNTGGVPMTITRIERTGDHRAMFGAPRFSGGDVWQGSEAVAADNSVYLFVTFTPADPGPKTCTITVTTNAQNPTASVTLQGTGTPGVPRLEISPVVFDAVAAGGDSFKGFYIRNRGGGPFTVTQIVRSGPDAAMFECSDLDSNGVWNGSAAVAGSGTHTIYFSFAPPVGTGAGTKTCTITVHSDAPGTPHSMVLNGTVT